MAYQFKKANKEQSKLRAAVFAPSGAGKTYSSLSIAKGIAGEIDGTIAVIDTERGSASKYADRFDFDVLDLESHTIESYIAAINAAGEAGYAVLVIDSLSHAWKELLEEVDKLAAAKYRGNSFSAWSEGTPKQKELVNAILQYPGHVIATMRTKTEWVTETGKNGKSAPTRVGLAPEQGKGIEYEFDLLMEINIDHLGIVTKDRTGRFQDKMIEKPGVEFGKEMIAWLNDGEPPKATKKDVINAVAKWSGREGEALKKAVLDVIEVAGTKDYDALMEWINARSSDTFGIAVEKPEDEAEPEVADDERIPF